jgi:hypothetical protein
MQHPAGPMGVALKLYSPNKLSQADMVGMLLGRKRLRVSSACGRRRSHLSCGNVGATPARMARKWSLKVQMALSAWLP